MIRFAVVSVLALGVSLAGVLGGHRVLASILWVPSDEEASAVSPTDGGECPADLHARDACDYDDDTAPPGLAWGAGDSCGGDQDPGPPMAGGPRRDVPATSMQPVRR